MVFRHNSDTWSLYILILPAFLEIHKSGQMDISACCEEFREQFVNIVNLNMAKAANKKPNKQRPTKYDEKLAINGKFLDVFKVIKKHKEEK